MDGKSFLDKMLADTDSAEFTAQDRAILGQVESALTNGLRLKQWWEQIDATNGYVDRFETVCTFNRPDHSFAFFDQAPLHGQTLPVLGDVMDLFYDRPKSPAEAAAAEWMRDQMREFILHYFMRVSDFRRPQAYLSSTRPEPPALLRPLSWCPEPAPTHEGFGYAQFYYKLRDSGRIGKFPEEQRFAIVDGRELQQKYAWIVLRIRIFDFNLVLRPFGSESPQLEIPLSIHQWVVMSPDFIVNQEHSAPGVLGTYGYGYAVLKDPTERSLLAYGPGQFDTGFQLFHFRMLESGEVRTKLVFVVNRPERIVHLSLDPVTWSFTLADLMSFGLTSSFLMPVRRLLDQLPARGGGLDPVFSLIALLNLVTGGLAARELCISRDDLEKSFLVQHFMQNYELIAGSLLTWRQIPNWLDSASLPAWIVRGISA